MEAAADLVEPATPAQSYHNVTCWRQEDSGYHTFTPSSIEFSETSISYENLEQSIGHTQFQIQVPVNVDVTPEAGLRTRKRYGRRIASTTPVLEAIQEPAANRRGTKRPHSEDTGSASHSCTGTPTSIIAGGIKNLKVTDSGNSHKRFSSSSVTSNHSNVSSSLHYLNENTQSLVYPTTPVKKICRTSCKLSPTKRSAKKSSFTIHSLSCESNGIIKHRPHSKVVRTIQFRPDQKFDIVKMLYQNRIMPPLVKILSYLSNEDISNFSLVSPLWSEVFRNFVGKAKKIEYKTYLMNVVENLENKEKGLTPIAATSQMRSLKEVHNVLNTCTVQSKQRSPPGTPRTNKFRKFTKSASMDSRVQLSCVRCQQPAKVTKESCGEEWGECTSATCSYQFCRFCMCHRHSGKSCARYDLEGPSPSKRRMNTCAAVATKRSRRNLRRLMI